MAKLQDGSIYRVVSFVNGRLWLQYYKGSSLQKAEYRFKHRVNLLKNYMNVRLELRWMLANHSYRVLDCWQQGLKDDYQESVKDTIARVDNTHRKLNKIGIYESGRYEVSASEREAMDRQLDWLFKQREMGLIELCDDERGCVYWHGVNCKCWFDINGQVLKKVQQSVTQNETPAPKPTDEEVTAYYAELRKRHPFDEDTCFGPDDESESM